MDYINVRKDLFHAREIGEIGSLTGAGPHLVVGLLYQFWSMLSSLDAHGPFNLTEEEIDRGTIPGFTAALMRVGWLTGVSGAYAVPTFCKFEGPPPDPSLIPLPIYAYAATEDEPELLNH